MNDELWELDATAQAQLVASGQASAAELVDAAIERIERLQPQVHALASFEPELARRRAREVSSGPLGGVPVVVKDLIAYPGFRHSMGSRLMARNLASEATPYSEALDAAGLVVLGKSTTSEFGLLGSTETLLEGTTLNPWNSGRSAGGSSGGSAAAVACGMVPLAHASDGGGSIRIPASMNGVFGFKPGGGRVRRSGPDDMLGLLVDHCVSWSVRDSARLLALTERPGDERIGLVEGPSRQRLRIGVYTRTLMGVEPSPTVRAALESTARLCAQLGHEVIDAEPPPTDGRAISDAFFTVAGAGMDGLATMMEPMLGRAVGEQDLEPFTLALIDWYRARPAGAMPEAMATIERLAGQMVGYLERFDVTLCPTIPVEPFELGTLAPTRPRAEILARTEELAGYTPIHNIARVPAMSVPLHVSDQGLPVGSHFAAGRGREATLLALAYELEEAAPWRHRRPALGPWAKADSRPVAHSRSA